MGLESSDSAKISGITSLLYAANAPKGKTGEKKEEAEIFLMESLLQIPFPQFVLEWESLKEYVGSMKVEQPEQKAMIDLINVLSPLYDESFYQTRYEKALEGKMPFSELHAEVEALKNKHLTTEMQRRGAELLASGLMQYTLFRNSVAQGIQKGEIPKDIEYGKAFYSNDNSEKFSQALFEWRNEVFAERLASAIARARAEKKEIIVITGAAHAEPMIDLFKRQFPKADVRKKINPDAEKYLKEMKNREAPGAQSGLDPIRQNR